MGKFHITRDGDPAYCTATVRPCPLSGEHYASLEAAALAVMSRDLTPPPPDLVPVGKFRGRPFEELAADRAYSSWILRQAWFKRDYPDAYRRVRRAHGVKRLRDDFNSI